MLNILVPTDFSKLSKVAVQYAVRIAGVLDGNITLLHVIDLQQTVKTALRMNTGVRDQLRIIQKKFQQLADEMAPEEPEAPIEIRFKISRGTTFSDTILKESRRLHSGLIVMGTKGASGLKKTLIGSNTASVLASSHIPILVVPEQGTFSPFRNVIYASDLRHLEQELKILIPYVEKFEAIIHILHIVDHGSDVVETEARIERAVSKAGYKNIVTLVTVDHEVDAAIESYISVTRADVVAMFTHKPSFYEKMLDRSVTRKMAFHSKIPLLAFNKVNGD